MQGEEGSAFAEHYYELRQASLVLGIGELQVEYLAKKGTLQRVNLPGYTKRFYLKDEVDALKREWDIHGKPGYLQKSKREAPALPPSKELQAILQGQKRLEEKLDTVQQGVETSHADIMRQLAESTLQLQRLTERVEDHETRIARLEQGRSVIPRVVVLPL